MSVVGAERCQKSGPAFRATMAHGPPRHRWAERIIPRPTKLARFPAPPVLYDRPPLTRPGAPIEVSLVHEAPDQRHRGPR